MTDCIFCNIAAGTVPSSSVYEDNDYKAFMDINPESPGHIQIIPKKHYRFVWDMPTDEYTEYMKRAQQLAQALRGTFGTDNVFLKIMGEEVAHAHVWLFPNPNEATGDKNAFEENQALIKEALGQTD
ncbi:MAG: HIT family protein [Patescibacteria group bacterium UBA2163]